MKNKIKAEVYGLEKRINPLLKWNDIILFVSVLIALIIILYPISFEGLRPGV